MDGKSIMDVLLDSAKNMGLHQITVHELEALSLPKVKEFTPDQIKKIRQKIKLSQNAMAKCLNVNPSTYQKWERGEVCPSGGNLKLLNLVYKRGLEVLIR